MKVYILILVIFCGVFGISCYEPESGSFVEHTIKGIFNDIANVTNAFRSTTDSAVALLNTFNGKKSKDEVITELNKLILSIKELLYSKAPALRIPLVDQDLKYILEQLESAVTNLPDAQQILSQACNTEEGGKKTYNVDLSVKKNFFAAAEYCKMQKMELVTIESENELENVRNHLKKIIISGGTVERFWTSGNNLGNKSTWKWLTNGKDISVFNWGKGEPNNAGGNQNCLGLYYNYYITEMYDDVGCDDEYIPICEYIYKNCNVS